MIPIGGLLYRLLQTPLRSGASRVDAVMGETEQLDALLDDVTRMEMYTLMDLTCFQDAMDK